MTIITGKPFGHKEAAPAQHACSSYFIYACYTIVAAFVLSAFWQNFLISESLGLLQFREIDDLAFQQVIRKVHLAIYNGAYAGIWQINDYGYGWIYWIFISVVTFPFYLLSKFYEIDWPLIVAPRQISLMFSVLSLVVMARLLRKSGVSPSSVAAATVIFCLFPTMGYFPMRFGTVSAVAFFALLSFYFAWTDRPSTSRGRLWAMLSLAIAGAIKLNGLLIAPIVGCLIIAHLSDRSIGGIVRAIVLPGVLFVLSLVILINPALLYAPFNAAILDSYIGIMKFYLVGNATARDTLLPIKRLYIGASGSSMNALAMGLLAAGIIVAIIRDKLRRVDYLIVLLGMIFISVYLMLTVKYPAGIMLYITAGLFLLILGAAGWDGLKKGSMILYAIMVIMLADASERAVQQFTVGAQSLGHLSYLAKSKNLAPQIQSAQAVNQCIPSLTDRNWSGQVFVDSSLPLLANGLTNPDACFSIAWGNLSADRRYCAKPIDYLVLDKRAPGAQSEEEFERFLAGKGPEAIPALREDRQSRMELDVTGKFGNQQFSLKCETERVKVFTAQQ